MQTSVIRTSVAELKATALVIEHDMAAVEAMSDRVHVLHQGALLFSGTIKDVREHPDVQAVYVGGRK